MADEPVVIEELLEKNPDFKDIIKNVGVEEKIDKDQQETLPEGFGTKEWNAEEFLEWWQSSQYAYEELTYERAIKLFEETRKIFTMKYKWASGEENIPTMGVTHMIMEGWVEDTCIVSKELRITIRSMPAKVSQSMELGIGQLMNEHTYLNHRAMGNYYTFETLAHMIQAINDEPIEHLTRKRDTALVDLDDHICKKYFIENMPAQMVDECRTIVHEFDKRLKLMMRGSLAKN